jgi:hypothetical protein
MRAIIERSWEHVAASLVEVDGRPLILRQLDWLAAEQITHVAITLGLDDVSEAIATCVIAGAPAALTLTLIRSLRPIPARDVAIDAQFPWRGRVVCVPATAMVDARLGPFEVAWPAAELRVVLAGPAADKGLPPAALQLVTQEWGAIAARRGTGWACHVTDAGAAARLSRLLTSGRLARTPAVAA